MPRELYIHRAVSEVLDAIPVEAWIPEQKVPVPTSLRSESQSAPMEKLAKIAYPVIEEMLSHDLEEIWTLEKIVGMGAIGSIWAEDGRDENILEAAVFIVSDLEGMDALVFQNRTGVVIHLNTEFCIRGDNLSLASVYDYCAHLAQMAEASPVEVERCRDYAAYLRGR